MHTHPRPTWRRAALLLACAAGPRVALAGPTTPPGAPAGAVTGLRILPGQGGAEVVIATSGDVRTSDFTLADPHRVIVDVQGATLRAAPPLYDKVPRAHITNVRMAQYRPDVVRIVLEFDAPRPYEVVRGASDVRLRLEGADSFRAWSSTAMAETVALGDILARDAAAPSVRPAGGSAGAASTALGGSSTAWSPSTGDLDAAQQEKSRISVTYVDAEIRDVIAAFAAYSGRTIVVGKGVSGAIPYLDIRDKPWDVALKAVLESQGLAAAEDPSGILRVDSYVNILAKQSSEPLQLRTMRLNYANAASLMVTVRNLLSRDCSAGQAQTGTAALQTGATGGQAGTAQGCIVRGSVMSDSLTNSLIITDAGSRLDEIQEFVTKLDIRTPQVAIKAKIILVNRAQIEDLGLRYDLSTPTNFFSQVVQRPDPTTPGSITPSANSVFKLGGAEVAAIANAASRVGNPTLSLMYSVALGKYDLSTFVEALSSMSLADVQAEPSIVTLNNRAAQIFAGDQIPFRQVDAGSLQGGSAQAARSVTNLVEAGIRLAVTPQVSVNRMITMVIRAENSSASQATNDGNPLINRQEVNNQLLVADGETAVVGGLTVTTTTIVREGIPFLKDLPFVGALFRRQNRQDVKRDLLLLITPHILDEGERPDMPRTR